MTHGNSDTFGIYWSENLPGLPTSRQASRGDSNQYSVYGANDMARIQFHSLTLSSNYSMAGFNMGGSYNNWSLELADPADFSGRADGNDHYG